MIPFTSLTLDLIDSLSVCYDRYDRFHEDYSPSFNIQNITMNLNSSESLAAVCRGCGANRNNYKIVRLLSLSLSLSHISCSICYLVLVLALFVVFYSTVPSIVTVSWIFWFQWSPAICLSLCCREDFHKTISNII